MLRNLENDEITRLRRGFNYWGIFSYFEDKSFVLREFHTNNEIYMIPPNMKKFIHFKEMYSMGIIIGILKKNFFPSLPFLYYVCKYSKSYSYVIINDHATELFLYGRNLFGTSILETSNNFKENDLVIVLNKKLEPLGLGITRFVNKQIKNNRITITNAYDLGYYLRKEQ
ncbi:MAG: PUA domain-containing protein [Nitrososphaeraceae archaeon]